LRASNYVGQIVEAVEERVLAFGTNAPPVAPLLVEEDWSVHMGDATNAFVVTNIVGSTTNLFYATNIAPVYATVTTTNCTDQFVYTNRWGRDQTGFPYVTGKLIGEIDIKIRQLLNTGRFVDDKWHDGTDYGDWFELEEPEYVTNFVGLLDGSVWTNAFWFTNRPTYYPPETLAGIMNDVGVGYVASSNVDMFGQITNGTAFFTRHPSIPDDYWPLYEVSWNRSHAMTFGTGEGVFDHYWVKHYPHGNPRWGEEWDSYISDGGNQILVGTYAGWIIFYLEDDTTAQDWVFSSAATTNDTPLRLTNLTWTSIFGADLSSGDAYYTNDLSWFQNHIQTFDGRFYTNDATPVLVYSRQTNEPSFPSQTVTIEGRGYDTNLLLQLLVETSEVVTASSATTDLSVLWYDITNMTVGADGIATGDTFAVIWEDYILNEEVQPAYDEYHFYLTRADLNERWAVLSNMVHITWRDYCWSNMFRGVSSNLEELVNLSTNIYTNYGWSCDAETNWLANMPPNDNANPDPFGWYLEGACPYTNWDALVWYSDTNIPSLTSTNLHCDPWSPHLYLDYQQWFTVESTATNTSAYWRKGYTDCEGLFGLPVGGDDTYSADFSRRDYLAWTQTFEYAKAEIHDRNLYGGFQHQAEWYSYSIGIVGASTGPATVATAGDIYIHGTNYFTPVTLINEGTKNSNKEDNSDEVVPEPFDLGTNAFLEGECVESLVTNLNIYTDCYCAPETNVLTATNQVCFSNITVAVFTNQSLFNLPDEVSGDSWNPAWINTSGPAARASRTTWETAGWVDNDTFEVSIDDDIAGSFPLYIDALDNSAVPTNWVFLTDPECDFGSSFTLFSDGPTGSFASEGGVLGTLAWDLSSGYDDPDSDWMNYCSPTSTVVPVVIDVCFNEWHPTIAHTNGLTPLPDDHYTNICIEVINDLGGGVSETVELCYADCDLPKYWPYTCPEDGQYIVWEEPTLYNWSTNLDIITTNTYYLPNNSAATSFTNYTDIITNTVSWSTNFWHTNFYAGTLTWQQEQIALGSQLSIVYSEGQHANTNFTYKLKVIELPTLLKFNFTGGFSRF